MQALVAPVQEVKFDIETALEMQLGAKPLPFPGMDKSGSGICTFHLKSICDIGSTCPFRHVRADRSVVCKHWLRGLCKKGDDCEFLHEYDMSKMPECYFFQKFGQCGNKECPFLHIDPEMKRKDCAWYDRGFCYHGAACKNRHVRRVMCQNFLIGFCPKGPKCKFAHPNWGLPVINRNEGIQRSIPTCHHCGDIGHVVYKCFKLTEDERAKYSEQYKRKEQTFSHQGVSYGHHEAGEHSNQAPSTADKDGQREKIPLDEVVCFKCGDHGHFANRCPKGHLAFISLAKNQLAGAEQ